MSKYKPISEYRIRIMQLREVEKWTFKAIALHLGILTADGRPNEKMTQDIGYKMVRADGEVKPYEPIDEEVRERLGLRPICPNCHRPVKHPTRNKAEAKVRINYKRLLINVALPALSDIWHSNDLVGTGRRERAKHAYKAIQKELGDDRE